MDQFNLFDVFGDDADLGFGTFAEETKVPEKKKEKAAGKKGAAGKGKNSDFTVSLPVLVKARGFNTTISGESDLKVSEIFTQLKERFFEVQFDGISASYDKEASILYITDAASPCDEDTEVDFSNGTVTICDGEQRCELELDNFPGKADDEVAVTDLIEKWCAVDSRYKGCRLAYAGNVAYPVFTAALSVTESVSLPTNLLHDGEWITLTDDMFSAADVTVDHIIKKYGGEENATVKYVLYSNLDKTAYFLSYKQKKAVSLDKGLSPLKKSNKKVEEKYPLPLNVCIATWNGMYQLRPDEFDGASKVSLAQIKEYFKPRYKIFGDTSRKLDVIYLEEEMTLSLMFVSGTKGSAMSSADTEHEYYGQYELLRSLRDLREAITRPFFHGTLVSATDAPDGSVRVESFPHGTFFLKQDDESGTIISVDFKLKLPKIPEYILDTVIAFFREDLDNEACVKVCYNEKSGEYFLVKSVGNTSKVSINYEIPAEGLIGNRNIIQVMDIHSHNTMRAIFSMTDDIDECYPGIFGVIGRLDQSIPEMRFRAGFEGNFKLLRATDLFEMGTAGNTVCQNSFA